jgi:hypothetical protein
MDIETIISLIVSQGIPVAEKLWQLWSSKTAVTQADWDALLALGKQNARSQMLLALAQNGIDPASPQGQALLALTPAS